MKTPIINNRKFIFLLMATFSIIGALTFVFTRAAVPAVSLEAESGSVIPKENIVNNGSSSNGKHVKFAYSPFVVAASGDVGQGTDRTRQAATADLVKRINPLYLIALGDLAYNSGTSQEFADNYAPYWGVPAIYNITKPIPGNHEYNTVGASGYFNYFDPNNTGKFGPRDKGYYSFVKDNWLFLQINSECAKITAGCANGGVQANWVDQQLAANPGKCVVASWHKPRVTSGKHTDATEMNDIWNKIVSRDGIVLTGHNHLYTRTNPLGTNALPNTNGITQFVIGTGGAAFYTTPYSDPVREVKKIESELGVLKLTFRANTYNFQFIGTNDVILDQGTDTLNCN